MKLGLREYHRRTVRDPGLLVAGALAVVVTSVSADVMRRSFDPDPVGAAPPGFSFAAARLPAAGRWLIRADGTNRYLAHLSDSSGNEGFALALLEATPPQELRLSARIKLAEGARLGGLVWHYQNPENFYAVSLDLTSQEVALYRVSRGNRIRLELEDDLELDRDAWHVLRVEHARGRIRVALGGIGVMRARAREDGGGEGRAGVWSAGSATTWFDDLTVQEQTDRDR
jgi:hypothetical protein